MSHCTPLHLCSVGSCYNPLGHNCCLNQTRFMTGERPSAALQATTKNPVYSKNGASEPSSTGPPEALARRLAPVIAISLIWFHLDAENTIQQFRFSLSVRHCGDHWLAPERYTERWRHTSELPICTRSVGNLPPYRYMVLMLSSFSLERQARCWWRVLHLPRPQPWVGNHAAFGGQTL